MAYNASVAAMERQKGQPKIVFKRKKAAARIFPAGQGLYLEQGIANNPKSLHALPDASASHLSATSSGTTWNAFNAYDKAASDTPNAPTYEKRFAAFTNSAKVSRP